MIWLPVDTSFESGDQSAVDTGMWKNVVWVPLGLALRSLRPLGRPTYQITPTARGQVAAVEEWMADSHCLPEVVAMLWTSAAALRIKKVVKNPIFAQRKMASEAKTPMLVLSNPLYVVTTQALTFNLCSCSSLPPHPTRRRVKVSRRACNAASGDEFPHWRCSGLGG